MKDSIRPIQTYANYKTSVIEMLLEL